MRRDCGGTRDFRCHALDVAAVFCDPSLTSLTRTVFERELGGAFPGASGFEPDDWEVVPRTIGAKSFVARGREDWTNRRLVHTATHTGATADNDELRDCVAELFGVSGSETRLPVPHLIDFDFTRQHFVRRHTRAPSGELFEAAEGADKQSGLLVDAAVRTLVEGDPQSARLAKSSAKA